jgi:molecular chaperone IbpA
MTTSNFDRVFDEMFKPFPSNSFPLYNIVADSETKSTIELAVAGFSKEELKVELLPKNVLQIKGEHKESEKKNYSYQGITNKSFTRTFTLHENAVIDKVKLLNGILSISLDVVIPEEKKPKLLEIH